MSSCISNRVQYSCVFSFRFRQVLRAPELVKDNGSPLVDNSMFSAFTGRLLDRLASVKCGDCTVRISAGMLSIFENTYVKNDSTKKLTCAEIKTVLLVLPSLLRDLIRPEVCLCIATFQSCEFICVHLNYKCSFYFI